MRRLLRGDRVPSRAGVEVIKSILAALEIAPASQNELLRQLRTSAMEAATPPVAAPVERILELQRTASALPRNKNTSIYPLAGELVYFQDIQTLARLLRLNNADDVWVFTSKGFFEAELSVKMLEDICSMFRRVHHIFAELSSDQEALRIVETLLAVHADVGIASDRYNPMMLANPSLWQQSTLLASQDWLLSVAGFCRASGRFYGILHRDRRLLRIAASNLKNLVRHSRPLLTMYGLESHTHMGFQAHVNSIEARTSIRHSVIAEGLSFMTHPPAWYQEGSKFVANTRYQEWFTKPQTKAYMALLRERLARVGRDFKTVEICSEAAIVEYLRTGATQGTFYRSPFSIKQRWEHVCHLAELIKSPAARFTLMISNRYDLAVGNKTWVAYTDAVSFGRHLGEDNVRMVIENPRVASAFGRVFESLKRPVSRKLGRLGNAADSLLSMATTHIPHE